MIKGKDRPFVAPEQPEETATENRKWRASAAIHHGGHSELFLVELGQYLDAQFLGNKPELTRALGEIAEDPRCSLDEAVEIAEAHRFDAHDWVRSREGDAYSLAQAYKSGAGFPSSSEEH